MPVYNGADRVKISLGSLLKAIEKLSFEQRKNVFFHISDNASTDNLLAIYEELIQNKEGFYYSRNDKNIEGGPNMIKGFSIDYGQDYTWIIADDTLLPDYCLTRFFELMCLLDKKNHQVDLLLVNYGVIYMSDFFRTDIDKLASDNKIQSWRSIRKFNEPVLTNLSNLIDPLVDNCIIGSTPSFIFNSELFRQNFTKKDWQDFLYKGEMNAQISQPLPYCVISIFNKSTICLVDPMPWSYIVIDQQSWSDFKNEIFAIGNTNFLIECLKRDIIDYRHFLKALNGLIQVCRNDFKAIISSNQFQKLDQFHKDSILKAIFI